MGRGDRVHVLLPGGTGGLRGEVSLLSVIGLVETHDGLGASLDGLVDVGQPSLGGGVGDLVHHRDEGSTDILALGLSPVVGKAKVGAEGGAELTIVVSKTTLGSAVGRSAGRFRGSGGGSSGGGNCGAVVLLGDRGDSGERGRRSVGLVFRSLAGSYIRLGAVLSRLGRGGDGRLGGRGLLSSGSRGDDDVAGSIVFASLRGRKSDVGGDNTCRVGRGSTGRDGDGGLLSSSDGNGSRTALAASRLGRDILNNSGLGSGSSVDGGVDGLGRGGGQIDGGSLALLVGSSASRDLSAVVVTRPAASGVRLSGASSRLGVELGVAAVGGVSGGSADEGQKADLGHGGHIDVDEQGILLLDGQDGRLVVKRRERADQG